ncbi:hypothetical protein ACJVQT_19975 [Enterobacter huaxiensis]|uniref:hypothetical protein n=1 Tax=Enterobacter huaxiensis TaxID=2494702 RepID=UPI002175DF7A|nr:hypothetical protein [Enterobacter huaxiensis]MCS5452323.1 hypothetical protein [Enterobacter huaxiensis]
MAIIDPTKLIESRKYFPDFTETQFIAMALFSFNFPRKAIAEYLNVSEKTVYLALKECCEQAGVRTPYELRAVLDMRIYFYKK